MGSERRTEITGRVSAWAYAFGCACGWGAFVMPGNTFLPQAGPLGAGLGILIASVLIFLVGITISYISKKYPNDSGIHVYVGKILGKDHGFLTAWAVLFAYLSIIWANATAFVLLVRNISGDVFQFGFNYRIAGYDVWFGETLITSTLLIILGLLAIFGRFFIRVLHSIMTLIHITLVVGLFIALIILGRHGSLGGMGFGMLEYSKPTQILNISMLAPWMFVGIEGVTYMLGTGGRKAERMDKTMVFSVIACFFNYALLTLIPVIALPEGYSDWKSYLTASSGADGLFGLPVFYSVYSTLGNPGLIVLVISITCAIFTSIFGLYRMTGRLLNSMSENSLLPKALSKKNKAGEPYVAILIILIVSIFIPIFGRTAIGWIVDVTTISATVVYIYSSAGCIKLAKSDPKAGFFLKFASVAGIVMSVSSFLFLLVPNIWSENRIATESYFALAVWSICGLIYYWHIYRHDKSGNYGKSTAMWLLLLFLIFFSTIMWIRQENADVFEELGLEGNSIADRLLTRNAIIEMVVVALALTLIFSLFTILLRRRHDADKKAMESEARDKAKTAFLFNMSHDIRTPMNAILGFTDLALLDPGNEDKVKDYLGKVKTSGTHLLSLINDILEMSRIESGKIELSEDIVNLEELTDNIYSIMQGQAAAKEQEFTVDSKSVTHRYVFTDRLRLNQVLLNLISNAIKYTPEGGKIELVVDEIDGFTYRFIVKDNGMGMSPEFAAKIFEAFERDKAAQEKGIQGTGLGMAITKKIIDLMNGEITLDTAPDEGSTFTVDLKFKPASKEQIDELNKNITTDEPDFSGMRVLLTDDVDINREIGTAILEMMNFEVEQAEDGAEAVEKVLTNPAGYYDVVFLDIQMPKMNGYEAAKAIRAISDEKKAHVPIIAMTANAFEEDVRDAKNAGMNGHVAKPIDQDQLVQELIKVTRR